MDDAEAEEADEDEDIVPPPKMPAWGSTEGLVKQPGESRAKALGRSGDPTGDEDPPNSGWL
jgi:hypothetical protein